jgi:hypothetical protein
LKLIIALAARCRFAHQRFDRCRIFQYAVKAMECQKRSLIIFCVTLHQPFQRHVGDATNDEAVKITEIDEFIPSTEIGDA